MAHRYSGSLVDCEGIGSFSEELIPCLTHMGDRGNIPLETQQYLERASARKADPTDDEINIYANHTKLHSSTSRNWFNSQQAANFGNDDSYRLPEHSDPTNTAFLSSSEASSVQSDLHSISSWIVDKNESSADHGFYSNPSTAFGSLVHQHHNSSNYSASQFPLQITTEPSLNVYSEQTQPEALPAVGWNLRVMRTQACSAARH
jgi:hypothetical protein